ncbi:endopeptidase La [Desulfovibrio litoralis]|uniref:Lon protease n=1 Tax=Desulfovibrio litoralis DSM 11393 TaxID=1121455 RepID=A0A1M7TAU3_9BACT|nr:endopeptidase La [Desulfovibrio litoralis]SHN67808.1 ATP-dependent proteinase. Serine peptidase. MEROPS family S16 [Desulfovibrio litoralis DSM 11393]
MIKNNPDELQDNMNFSATPENIQDLINAEEDIISNNDIPSVLPVLPVRDVVVFNYMVISLYVGREKSVNAIEAALNGSKHLLVLTQKNEQLEDPNPSDLHNVGTIVNIMRMLKMPDGRIKVLVQGISRAKVVNFVETDEEKKYLSVEAEPIPEDETLATDLRAEALMRNAREGSEKLLSLRNINSPDVNAVLSGIDHPGRLADLIAANLRIKTEEAQNILEVSNPLDRLELVNQFLSKEIEVSNLQVKIQEKAREGMEKAHKDYFLREQLKAIRSELGDASVEDADDDMSELIEALNKADLPKEARKEADKQLKRLSSMHSDSSEASVVRTYLEWLADLPWKKISKDRLDIKKAQQTLDEDHFGLEKVKDRILEYLSVRKLNPNSKGPILCLVGPPGVGKTSLGRSVARALGRKFQRMSLGGIRDEAEIRGHRRTYIGSMPGRVIQSLKQAGTRNPVIMLDEIDKLGADYRGDPSSALLEVLDPEQNNTFSDHYLGLPFDLSKVMFICTANHLETIPSALLDRMEVIRIPGYTLQEKTAIAKRYLVSRQSKENGLKQGDITIADEIIQSVIESYTREAGLRNLERELGAVCRKTARRKAEGEKGPFVITKKELPKLLGTPRYLQDEQEKTLSPGTAYGLAWTPYGGEVLSVEVATMKGRGGVSLTGQLGDVMKESAQAAVSFARSHASELGIDPDFTKKLDIHFHLPAGATPKDGPSAGVTLLTALVSALSGKSVNAKLCMTGEITLRGKVLPVGGIKEKILAAVTKGLTDVCIPKNNIKDLDDIPEELRKKIKIHPVEEVKEVLALAFK